MFRVWFFQHLDLRSSTAKGTLAEALPIFCGLLLSYVEDFRDCTFVTVFGVHSSYFCDVPLLDVAPLPFSF